VTGVQTCALPISLAFILTLGLLLNGFLLCVLASGYSRVGHWWHLVARTTYEWVLRVGGWGQSLAEALVRLSS